MRNTNDTGTSGSLSTANHTSQTVWTMRILQCGRIIWRWANFILRRSLAWFTVVLEMRFHLFDARETQGTRKEHAMHRRLSPLIQLLAIVSYCSPGDSRGSHAWIRNTRILFSCALAECQKWQIKSTCCFTGAYFSDTSKLQLSLWRHCTNQRTVFSPPNP